MTRQCGDCQLCCKLLPMSADTREESKATAAAMIEAGMLTMREAANMTPDFFKPAGRRCPHQRHRKGCTIYSRRPFGCRVWNCRWLGGADDTKDLRRPDHAHYVIDISPDYVRVDPTGGNNPTVTLPVVQVWLDPDYPDAHRDPALRAFLIGCAEREGMAALVRTSNKDAFALIPPSMSHTGDWIEKRGGMSEREHTVADKVAAIGRVQVVFANEG